MKTCNMKWCMTLAAAMVICFWQTTAYAQITDNNWSALDQGFDNTVNALAASTDGTLYAGGVFVNTTGGILCDRVASWNGSVWSSIGGGITGSDVTAVHSLAVAADGTLYVAGIFTAAGGVPCNNIARWDGTSWSALSSGIDGPVYSLAINNASGILYAGGAFLSAGGVPCDNIASWDGTNWSPMGTGINGAVYTLAIDPASAALYAGGQFIAAGGVPCDNVASWNGTNWTALGPGTNGSISAVKVDAYGGLYAGGGFTLAGGVECNHVARWDGTTWNALGVGTDGPVYSLTIDNASGNLFAGGLFATAGGVTCNNIARWELTGWTALGSGTDSNVSALKIIGTNLYVGGVFSLAGGKSGTLSIARCSLSNPVTLGKIFQLFPTNITGYTIANFATKPSVKATYTVPFSDPPKTGSTGMKLMNKITGVSPSPIFADLEWTKTVKLVDSKEWLKTETCAQTLARLFPPRAKITSLNCELATKITFTNVAGEKVKLEAASTISVELVPPVIYEVMFTDPPGLVTAVAGPNTRLTIYGAYFGKSAPSVWLEYLDGTTVKKLKLKVQKPYAFDDYKGAHFKSCMDIYDGDSQINVTTPEWPSGWNHSVPHNIVIDNKVARATTAFNTTP